MGKSDAIRRYQALAPAAFHQRCQEDAEQTEQLRAMHDDGDGDAPMPLNFSAWCEVPPQLERTQHECENLILHDALVPLRMIDTDRLLRPKKGGERAMCAIDLACIMKRRIESALQRVGNMQRSTYAMCFDASRRVPRTKGVTQQVRRDAHSSPETTNERALADAQRPLPEVPSDGTPYLTYATELRTLGPWREVMDDRLPAEEGTVEEEEDVKTLADGRTFARHQGRRLVIVATLCMWLLRPADEEEPDPEIDLTAVLPAQATLQLRPGQKVLIDGSSLVPENFRREARASEDATKGPYWLDGFVPPLAAQLLNNKIDWTTVPIAVWRRPNETRLSMTFAFERRHEIGEADFAMFWHAEVSARATALEGDGTRALNVIVETSDTDCTHAALLFAKRHAHHHVYVRIPRRLTSDQVVRLRLAEELGDESDVRAFPLYVDAQALRAAIDAHFVAYAPHALECVVTVLLASGCDYVQNYFFVTLEKFWEAAQVHAAFVLGAERRFVEPVAPATPGGVTTWRISAPAFVRLIVASYAQKHDARLLALDKTRLLQTGVDAANEALRGERNGANGKRAPTPLEETKLIPSKADLRARFGTLLYAASMYAQIGEQPRLVLLESDDELRAHGFSPVDATRPMTRMNIRFTATPPGGDAAYKAKAKAAAAAKKAAAAAAAPPAKRAKKTAA